MTSEHEPRLRLAEDEHPHDQAAGQESKKAGSTFLVQVRKKVGGLWLEVASVDNQGAATTVGRSFLGANSAQAYRVLHVIEEKSR